MTYDLGAYHSVAALVKCFGRSFTGKSERSTKEQYYHFQLFPCRAAASAPACKGVREVIRSR